MVFIHARKTQQNDCDSIVKGNEKMKNEINFKGYKAEYITHTSNWRIYDPQYPAQTVAYEDSNSILEQLCEVYGININGIEFLVEYYTKILHWNEETAVLYAIHLFDDGVIDDIRC